MTTKQDTKSTPAPAKRPTAKERAAAKQAEATEPTPAPAPKAAAKGPYREAEGFKDALKAAKAVAKGNADLTNPLQLVTHLAWKTPGGSVLWAKESTTANVMAYADDIAVPEGTDIPAALEVALTLAEKGAADKPQTDAVAVLAKIVRGHNA